MIARNVSRWVGLGDAEPANVFGFVIGSIAHWEVFSMDQLDVELGDFVGEMLDGLRILAESNMTIPAHTALVSKCTQDAGTR
eukprot:3304992-Rhodomonas_salina.1